MLNFVNWQAYWLRALVWGLACARGIISHFRGNREHFEAT